jgi:hypothetical protein
MNAANMLRINHSIHTIKKNTSNIRKKKQKHIYNFRHLLGTYSITHATK